MCVRVCVAGDGARRAGLDVLGGVEMTSLPLFALFFSPSPPRLLPPPTRPALPPARVAHPTPVHPTRARAGCGRVSARRKSLRAEKPRPPCAPPTRPTPPPDVRRRRRHPRHKPLRQERAHICARVFVLCFSVSPRAPSFFSSSLGRGLPSPCGSWTCRSWLGEGGGRGRGAVVGGESAGERGGTPSTLPPPQNLFPPLPPPASTPSSTTWTWATTS